MSQRDLAELLITWRNIAKAMDRLFEKDEYKKLKSSADEHKGIIAAILLLVNELQNRP